MQRPVSPIAHSHRTRSTTTTGEAMRLTVTTNQHARAVVTVLGDEALVSLPAVHVHPAGALALQQAWVELARRGGVARAGADAHITYDRSRAATSAVRVTVTAGRVVGTLSWGLFTAHGAAAVQAAACALHEHLSSSATTQAA